MSEASIGEQQLRALYGEPRDLVREAWAPELEATTRAFIQASPFMVLSSVNAEGFVDTSPRGGPPGFVQVVDNRHLRFLDQPGNRKVHTLTNLLGHNKVGLCFFIPGIKEVVRAHGVATASDDPEVIAAMGGNPERNKLSITIALTKVFPHCSNALNKAGLWDPDSWRKGRDGDIPSLMQMAQSLAAARE